MADLLRRALQVALSPALCALSVTAAQAAPPPAPPSPNTEEIAKARELFLQAQADETRGDYLSALEKFEHVAETKTSASVRFHLGYCSERLGRLASALHHYNLSLRDAERENNADVKRAAMKATEALAPRVPRLTLLCPSEVPSCTVSLDGRVLTSAELSVFMLVDPGSHHVSASAPNLQPFETDVIVRERDARTVQITLASATTPNAATPTAPHPSVAAAPPRDPSDSTAPRTGAFVAAGGALALVGLGVGSFFGAAGAQDTLKTTCATQVSCDADKSTVRVWDTVALTSFVAAGALAVVATVLFLQPHGQGSKTSHLSRRTVSAAPRRFPLGVAF